MEITETTHDPIKLKERIKLLNTAKRSWECARQRFELAETTEQIELAIFDIEASKRRYMYLLLHGENASNDF